MFIQLHLLKSYENCSIHRTYTYTVELGSYKHPSIHGIILQAFPFPCLGFDGTVPKFLAPTSKL